MFNVFGPQKAWAIWFILQFFNNAFNFREIVYKVHYFRYGGIRSFRHLKRWARVSTSSFPIMEKR